MRLRFWDNCQRLECRRFDATETSKPYEYPLDRTFGRSTFSRRQLRIFVDLRPINLAMHRRVAKFCLDSLQIGQYQFERRFSHDRLNFDGTFGRFSIHRRQISDKRPTNRNREKRKKIRNFDLCRRSFALRSGLHGDDNRRFGGSSATPIGRRIFSLQLFQWPNI